MTAKAPLGTPPQIDPDKPKRGKGGSEPPTVANRWRDVSAAPLTSGRWFGTAAYWNWVQARVVKRLRHYAGLLPDTTAAAVCDDSPF